MKRSWLTVVVQFLNTKENVCKLMYGFSIILSLYSFANRNLQFVGNIIIVENKHVAPLR